ncbi:hypothetical protein GALL_449830 [mine drainage metagenome]|uniref:Uncharacterized protein n=1 Tax=mine drainage metagenome TaxID=410659 RepID=A0A1J5Q0K4_9ZZZZ
MRRRQGDQVQPLIEPQYQIGQQLEQCLAVGVQRFGLHAPDQVARRLLVSLGGVGVLAEAQHRLGQHRRPVLEHEVAQLGVRLQSGEDGLQMAIEGTVQQAAELGPAQRIDRVGLLLFDHRSALGDVALQVVELALIDRGVFVFGVDDGLDHAGQKRQEALCSRFVHTGKPGAVFGHAVEQLARRVAARAEQAGVAQAQTQHRNLQSRQLRLHRRQQLGVGEDVVEQQRHHVDGQPLQRARGHFVQALAVLLDEVDRGGIGAGLVAPVHVAQAQPVGEQQAVEGVAQLWVQPQRLAEDRGTETALGEARRTEARRREAGSGITALRHAGHAPVCLSATAAEQLLQRLEMQFSPAQCGSGQGLALASALSARARRSGSAASSRAILRRLDLHFRQPLVVERVSILERGRHSLAESAQQRQPLLGIQIHHAQGMVQRAAEHLGPQRIGHRNGALASAQAVEPGAQVAHFPLRLGFEQVGQPRDLHALLQIGVIDQTQRLELGVTGCGQGARALDLFVEHLLEALDKSLGEPRLALAQSQTHVGIQLPIPAVARDFRLLLERLDHLMYDRADQLVRALQGVVDALLKDFGGKHRSWRCPDWRDLAGSSMTR